MPGRKIRPDLTGREAAHLEQRIKENPPSEVRIWMEKADEATDEQESGDSAQHSTR